MTLKKTELALRIVVDGPVPGLVMALQRGAAAKAELLAGDGAIFEFAVTADGALPDGRPRLLGPFVQGPPAERFVYLCVGKMAGQADSPWAGRVKVPLGDITAKMVAGLKPGARLEAHIPGRGRRDGPALATVKLLGQGWRAVG
jgi:hypothetical protein